jgi:hypothetical protein
MSSRRARCLQAILAGLVSCLVPVEAAAQVATGRVEVTGTGVSLVPPPEFKANSQTQGFVGPNNATIVVIELEQPFAEMSAGLKQAKRDDMAILAARPTKLENGRLATWAHIRQTYRGEVFSKWILFFGDAKTTITVTVTVPERYAPEVEKALAQSLETVRWSPAVVSPSRPSTVVAPPLAPTPPSSVQPALPTPSRVIDTAGLSFTIGLAPGFEHVLRVGPTLGIGLIGVPMPDTSGSPFLAVGSAEPVGLDELSVTTMGFFMQTTPDLFSQRIGQTTGRISIGGKPAHEVVGRARHSDGYQVALYAVIVAGAPSLRIFGRCRLEDQAKYLASFRQMAESLSPVKQ